MKTILLICLFALGVAVTEAGECCNAYYDILGDYVSAQWCENYCCGSTVLSLGLYCCSSSSLQADASDTDFCSLWWTHHVWVPIVSCIVIIGLIIGCCVCCCRVCCCPRDRTVIVQPGFSGQAGPSMVSVQQSSTINAGYDQSMQYPKY